MVNRAMRSRRLNHWAYTCRHPEQTPQCAVMENTMRRFEVYRRGDLSETHNKGLQGPTEVPQYEGIQFTDGTVAVRWRTAFRSTSLWGSFDELMHVHGHLNDPIYQTDVVWLDH
jgi:hypothetical protein